MIGVTSVAIIYFGIQQIINPGSIEFIVFAYLVLSLSILTNGYSFMVSSRRILNGRKISHFFRAYQSSQKIEEKTTFVLDFKGTISAIIGLIALTAYGITGDLRYDGLGAVAIGITMSLLTLFLIKGSRELLIGKRASVKIERNIRKIVRNIKNVKSVLDLKTMNIGLGKVLAIVEVHINRNLTTKKIELLIDKIKEEVKKNVPEVKLIQIEIETPDSELNVREKTSRKRNK